MNEAYLDDSDDPIGDLKREVLDLRNTCVSRYKELSKWKELCRELLDSFKDIMNHGLQYENGEIHQGNPIHAKELIERAEKELSK